MNRLRYYGIPYFNLDYYDIDKNVLSLLSIEVCLFYKIIAIEKTKNILTLGVVAEKNDTIIDLLEKKLNLYIVPAKVDEDKLINYLHNNYVDKVKYSTRKYYNRRKYNYADISSLSRF